MLNRFFSPFPTLTTERLTLRQLKGYDEQEIFALRSDREINRYLNRPISKTIDDARTFINIVNENIANNDSLYWAMALNNSNKLVGTICLFGFSDVDDKCEIGFELFTDFQRQGLMSEAIKKVIDYAFNKIGVQKMEAFVHRNNQNSVKLLERLSFRPVNKPNESDPDVLTYDLNSMVDFNLRF